MAVNWDNVRFVKSSYSGGAQTECVEFAHADGLVGVRDSKRKTGSVTVEVPAAAWGSFLDGLRGGDFAR